MQRLVETISRIERSQTPEQLEKFCREDSVHWHKSFNERELRLVQKHAMHKGRELLGRQQSA